MECMVLFGGTFDPIHNGHLLIAEKLYNLLKNPITFVPTAVPNYKALPKATNQQRLDMLQLALNDDPRFKIDTGEIFSSKYLPTYLSLTNLRKKIGYTLPIFFLIGGDSLVTLDSWDNWQQLFKVTNFIVVARPGYLFNKMSHQLFGEFNKRVVAQLENINHSFGQIYILDIDPINISSTMIRNFIAAKLPIDTLVNPNVEKYILEHQIYF